MPRVDIAQLAAANRLQGPYHLFSNSFILDFLEPPEELAATVLMRCTYVSPTENPLNAKGRAHPQSPPLHLHFDQSESFLVAQGEVCTTEGYDVEERTWTPEDGVRLVEPWVPHSFHPSKEAKCDSIIYLWAHPTAVPDPMDTHMFATLLRCLSAAHAANRPPNLLQMMVTQHASATAMVMFPTAWWLGPLRWWVPWVLQGGVAAVGRACGYRALMEEYMPAEEWSSYLHAKRA